MKLQKTLSEIFLNIYRQPPSVHGFCKDRSVVSNSSKQLTKKSIVNIDLKDFFNSVHFGRIKFLLKSKPFNLPTAPATVLAQICCHQNSLPQGAPTSPVLTNMICLKMDRELENLAARCNATYSRYVDDMTFSFSFKKHKIPKLFLEDAESLSLSQTLLQIIDSNGFRINFKKVRVYSNNQRMLVTGIKVNKFPNVQRVFIRRINSMLYSWKKHGVMKMQQIHFFNIISLIGI